VLDFLRDVNLGKKVDIGKKSWCWGRQRGFRLRTAARRLGGCRGKVGLPESMETMPASGDEIQQGEEEGIMIYPPGPLPA